MGSIDKTMEEIVTRGSFCHFLIKEFLQCTGLDFRCRCSKNYALTLLDWHVEITRYIEILIGSIATLLLLRILHATIPVWGKNKLILLGELHIKVWITCIHTSLDTIIHCRILTGCCSILMGKLTHASECQEWTETQGGSRMTIHHGVSDQDAIFIMLKYDLLF